MYKNDFMFDERSKYFYLIDIVFTDSYPKEVPRAHSCELDKRFQCKDCRKKIVAIG